MPEVGTRLHAATTKSQSGDPCKLNNDPNEGEMQKKSRPVTAQEAGNIANRLYSAKTKSAGENCKYEPTVAKDIVERKGTNVKDSTARLSAASTKSWSAEVCKAKPTVAEPPDIKLSEEDVDDIVERLNKTHTKSSSAKPCRAQPVVADNSIARKPENEDEVHGIFDRLRTTHTKSSSGGVECRQLESIKTPGLGQKMLPDIEGLDERFSGKKTVKKENAESIFTRLTSAHTRSSKARGENPKILLYPERTLLCNNVSRIVAYQQSGETVKQGALARREKWFI